MGKLVKRGIAMVVITGATGYLGKVLGKELLSKE